MLTKMAANVTFTGIAVDIIIVYSIGVTGATITMDSNSRYVPIFTIQTLRADVSEANQQMTATRTDVIRLFPVNDNNIVTYVRVCVLAGKCCYL
jgi:hypothetical protein